MREEKAEVVVMCQLPGNVCAHPYLVWGVSKFTTVEVRKSRATNFFNCAYSLATKHYTLNPKKPSPNSAKSEGAY